MRLIIALFFFIVGCADKPAMRFDPNPAPIDPSINYYTLLLEACGTLAYGQGGCSYGHDEVIPKTDELAVYTPMGGSLSLFSRECGIDVVKYVKAGGRHSWPVEFLMPEGVSFCLLDLIATPKLPKGFESEYPVRSTHGQAYLRRRPEGARAAFLEWSPQAGSVGISEGIAFSQFRAMAPLVPTMMGLNLLSREPIILKVMTSRPTTAGTYQLYGSGIGVKSTPFKGDTIEIPKSIIMTSKPDDIGSYVMFGWAVDADGLNEDFVVGINAFGYRNKKLAVDLWMDGTNACFAAEDPMSFAVTAEGKWSNEVEDCLEVPETGTMVGFFTHVGRTAYYLITAEKEIRKIE